MPKIHNCDNTKLDAGTFEAKSRSSKRYTYTDFSVCLYIFKTETDVKCNMIKNCFVSCLSCKVVH